MSEQSSIEDYPIRGNQRRYLLAERFTSASYMISVVHPVEGALDVGRLERAARTLVGRHEVLRSRFRPVRGEYRVSVEPQPAFAFKVVDLPDGSFETFRRAALPLIMDDIDVCVPASLVRFVVGRVEGGQAWRVCFASHHAISDGVSRALAMKQLFQLYDGLDLPACPSFYEFVDAGAPSAEDEAFWRAQASQAPVDMSLRPDRESTTDAGLGEFVVERLDLGGAEFRRLAAGMGARNFACLAAAYALGLMRITGQSRILFTFQSAGRKTVAAPASVFGPFSNTLPLVAEIRLGESFSGLVERLQREIELALVHEAVPFDAILKSLPDRPAFSLNLFPRELPPSAEGLRIGPREFLDRQTEYAMNLVWSEDGEDFNGRAYYDATRFSAGRIANFLATQKTLLQAALRQPDRTIHDLLALVGGEDLPLDPRFLAPPALNVIGRFIAQAEARPHADAIRTGGSTWTYGDLLGRADGWADRLLHSGLQPGDRVALLASRGRELVAAILGVARAGGSFAVLDVSYPASRITEQIGQLRPRFGIVLDERQAALRADHRDLIWLDAGGAPAPSAARYPGPSAGLPLYFLFTSGTTGTAKCVGHGAEILTFYTDWERETFSLAEADCVSMLSGLNHDPVMRDLFVPLAGGAALAIPDEDQMGDPRKLREFLLAAKVTVIHLTPPLGHLLALEAEPGSLAGVRLFVWGGDELPGHQARTMRAMAPASTQVNLYGTSETSQAASVFIIRPGDEIGWRTVPIGQSVPWMRCTCVTPDGRACGRGEAGELRVSMPFPVFLMDAPDTEGPGSGGPRERTVQQTGDTATVLHDGNLLFAGRRDDQVKIRGFRVDLGEVTSALLSLAGIDQAVTLAHRQDHDRTVLVAFCVPGDAAPPTPSELRRALHRRLPSYMVPERIHLIERMPLLPNGKLDRRTLLSDTDATPAPTLVAAHARVLTARERELAAIFAKALGHPVTDASSCLYDLGADSLSMIEARLALEEAGYRLEDGWEALPISDLAGFGPGDDGPRSRLLQKSSIESFIALRAIAICMIVALHFKLFMYDGGATSALFIVAGIVLAKFTMPRIIADDSASAIWKFILKIMIAFYPVTLLIFVLRAIRHESIHYTSLTLTTNFLINKDGQEGYYFASQWYIHCYVQVVFILALLLSSGRIRAQFRSDPFQTALVGTVLSAMLFVLTALWFDMGFVGLTPSATRMPVHGMMLVLTGMALAFARSTRDLVIVLAIAFFVLALRVVIIDEKGTAIAAASLVFLTVFPRVVVPTVVGRIMATISSASLFIYLLHAPIHGLASRLVDLQKHPFFAMIGTIAVCVALWKLWLPIVQRIVAWIVGRMTPRDTTVAPSEQGI
ncbi:MAG: AMP-binding protein [Alsobacter sp.]